MKNLMWTKLFYLSTKGKVRQNKHFSFPVADFKRITIEVGVNLHSIHLLPSFNIFWRGGYWSASLDFLCAGFAVMVENVSRVIVKEGGDE